MISSTLGVHEVCTFAPRTTIPRTAVDDPNVQVRVVLTGWAVRAITLDVGLCGGEGEVMVATVAVERLYVGLELRAMGDSVEREKRIGADLLEQDDERPAEPSTPR